MRCGQLPAQSQQRIAIRLVLCHKFHDCINCATTTTKQAVRQQPVAGRRQPRTVSSSLRQRPIRYYAASTALGLLAVIIRRTASAV